MRRREFIRILGGRGGDMAARRTRSASPEDSTYRLDYSWFSRRRLCRHLFIFSYYDRFSGGLKDLGYVDGSNITLLARSALGVPEALPGLVEELLRENVSVIVSPGPAIRAVRDKVKSTPVVFAFSGDPVAAGFVDTLAHGKENLTGLSYMAVELNGKRLDLMKELLPTVSRVTLLTNPIHPGEHLEVAESQRVAAGPRPVAVIPPGAITRRVRFRVSRHERQQDGSHRGRPRQSHHAGADTFGRVCARKMNTCDFRMGRICAEWRVADIRAQFQEILPPPCGLRQQDRRRRKAQRNAHRAAHGVRTGDQPQNSEIDWTRHSGSAARPRRRGDRMKRLRPRCLGALRGHALRTAEAGPLSKGREGRSLSYSACPSMIGPNSCHFSPVNRIICTCSIG